jgi:mRNA interferase MazF
MRGKMRPAAVIQSDAYTAVVGSVVVAEITTNLALSGDPACLFIDMNTPDGQATGLVRDSVLSCLLLMTVYSDNVSQVLGSLSAAMMQKLNDCLKAALALP